MVKLTVELGKMINHMEKVIRQCKMDLLIMAILIKGLSKVMENIFGLIKLNTRDTGIRINFMEMANIFGKMAVNILASGKIAKCMAKGS